MSIEKFGLILENLTEIHQSFSHNVKKFIGDDIWSFYENNQKLTFAFGSSICALLTYYILRKRNDGLEKIPGPPQIPIFGNFLDFRGKVKHLHYEKIAKNYGKICKVKLWKYDIIIVSSLEAIQEILVEKSKDFSGRPGLYRLKITDHVPDDIIFTNHSPEWHARKKLAMKSMKMYGDGLEDLEKTTNEILDDLFKQIDSKNGKPWMINEDLVACFLNIIFSLAFGRKLEWNDPDITFLKEAFDESQAATISIDGIILDVFPWLWKLGFPRSICKALQKRVLANEWFEKEITKHLKTYDPNNLRGYLDIFYQEYLKEQNSGKSKLSYPQLVMTTIQTLIAGYATTATAVTCFIQILMKYQDIQERIYKEIVENVGTDKRPTLNDKPNHHFLQACLLELLRFISHIPGVGHTALQDATLCGYNIPKNTYIYVALWNLHHDESIFPDPYTFKPERFLDGNDCLVSAGHPNRRALFPFGAGRRVCLGETLAKNRLFLTVSALIQRYRLLPESDLNIKDIDPRNYANGVVLNPGPVNVKMIKRN